MQISSRFTIAIHIFSCIEYFQSAHKITSEFLADSIQVNPVIIRKILAQLKKAGLVNVARGAGGATSAKPVADITLFDVYQAVDSVENGELFHFHDNPNPQCPVGRNIHNALDDKLAQVQAAFENEMKSITIQDVVRDTQHFIALEGNSEA
ncbi:Rrf2 family transcriptional regulator [Alloscardovia criceti]|uniref:Rrf2 family transcriptional regulator n=1 Tax=Alloscardovia criceti TaxID=356828 RepID=UPI00035E9D67|nr:Rrf2 family transcriptional regulator [Alloscardovia criceti]